MSNDIRILVAEDDPHMQGAISAALSRAGYQVTMTGNGQEALLALERGSFDLIISDQQMPVMSGQDLLSQLCRRELGTPFIMITAYGTINQAVEAMQLGAADFVSKPFSSEDLLRVIDRVLSPEHRAFRGRSTARSQKKGRPIITNDPVLKRILEVCEAVARSDATVLIQGESGTGKELIARLVHASSPRAALPFVAVNCAALPDTLLESELFGHEKGAFTGAQTRKIGKFELAQGGTILLDEISEMELTLQAKLLRVLQERELDRLGGKEPIAVDVRVLATTNRNLLEAVEKGSFREDLYYRLNVIPIMLPPLRERKSDIKLLVEFYMSHYLGDKAPRLSQEVLKALEDYSWPGNVRELQNAVERASILSQGSAPAEHDFFVGIGGFSGVYPTKPGSLLSSAAAKEIEEDKLVLRSGMTVQEMEKALIIETLKSTKDNRTEAARLLGISIRTLRNKLNEYKMDMLD